MTVADVKNRLQQKIHGQSLNKLQDVNGLLREAAANIVSRIDAPTTIRVSPIANGLYDDVTGYACPTDLKGDRIIAVRPQGFRTVADGFTMTGADQFYRSNATGDVYIEPRDGGKVLRVSAAVTSGATLHTMDSVTANGTWAATASASGLAADTTNFVAGTASLMFDLAAAGSSGYIENSDMTAVDLSADGYGTSYSVFVSIYLPSSTAITSAVLRWGSSSSNYYTSSTVTATHEANAFVQGWNLLRFDRSSAGETGTVDDAAIDYIRVTVNYGGTAVSSIRVDSIVARIPTAYELAYYSRYLFRSTGGTWAESVSDDTDIVNLDPDGVSLLVYEAAILASQELHGEDAQADIKMLGDILDKAETAYRSANKSDAKKRHRTYYRVR